MSGLETLTSLQSLWLGKNKIEAIAGIGHLPRLRQLDLQNNRLTGLGDGIVGLTSLEELYLACNSIGSIDGLPAGSPLSTLDLSTNQIASVEGIQTHQHLTELWMTKSLLSSFEALHPLTLLPSLSCLYLEHSPIATDYEYRLRITAIIPSLEQLDATQVRR